MDDLHSGSAHHTQHFQPLHETEISPHNKTVLAVIACVTLAFFLVFLRRLMTLEKEENDRVKAH